MQAALKAGQNTQHPPIEKCISFSTITFLNIYDCQIRKLHMVGIHSTVEKRAKRTPDITVETTFVFGPKVLTPNNPNVV